MIPYLSSREIKRAIERRYVTAVVLLGVLIAFEFFAAALLDRRSQAVTDIVSISGRQSSLSQRIVVLAREISDGDAGMSRSAARDALAQAIDRMSKSHVFLTGRDPLRALPIAMNDGIRAAYFGDRANGLDARVNAFLAAARRIVTAPDRQVGPENDDLRTLVDAANGPLLAGLDSMVERYEKQGKDRTAFLSNVAFAMGAVTLLILLFIALSVFRPLARTVGRSVAELESARKTAETSLADAEVVRDLHRSEAETAKEAVKSLQAARALFKDSIENMADGFLVWDAEDKLVICNSTVRRLYPGLMDVMREGVSFYDCLRAGYERNTFVKPDEMSVDEVIEEARKNRRKNRVTSFQSQLGDERWLSIRQVTTKDDYVVARVSDITAAKEAEIERAEAAALMKTTLENMDQGLVAFDSDLVVVASNRRVAELLDLPVSMFEVGADATAIIRVGAERGDYGPGVSGDWADKLIGNMYADQLAISERHLPDGRVIAVRSQPLPNGGGVVTYSDITEDIETQNRIGRIQKMEAIGLLAGNIAHEFNNLLTTIGGFTRMALKKPNDPKRVVDCLTEVSAASERASELTGQMLNFSQDRGSEPKVVDAGGVIASLSKMLEISVDRTIVLSVDASGGAAEDEPPVKVNVDVDPTRLSQSLLNLTINGCHAMPDGGTLSVGFAVVDSDEPLVMSHGDALPAGRYARYFVADSGCGIEPDVLGKIFDPFYTTKDEVKGTGLGLSYVYGTVTHAGGGIDVTSTVGEGTTVSLYLPVTDKEPDDAVIANAVADEDVAIDGTVLVAEDDPQLRAYLKQGLEDVGLTVITAPDGEEAERLYIEQADDIDLLVTDVVMPRKTGVELVESLSERYPELRAVFVTGYAPELSSHLDGLNHDATIIRKPFTAEALIGALRNKLAA